MEECFQKILQGHNLVIVIDVPSVEKHLKKIESTGGKIVMPAIKVVEFGFVCQNF